jgi:hypothetical protein
MVADAETKHVDCIFEPQATLKAPFASKGFPNRTFVVGQSCTLDPSETFPIHKSLKKQYDNHGMLDMHH